MTDHTAGQRDNQADDSPATIRRRLLAVELADLRAKAGLNQQQVAEWTGYSQSMISKLEGATRKIETKHVRMLCQCYGVGSPELDRLLRAAAESDDRGLLVAHADTMPDWARPYFGLEAAASELRVFEPGWVFGLFQTRDYVRAARLAHKPDATEDELNRSANLREARQERLRGENPPKIHVILDEAVLHRAVGGPAVMESQAERLVELSLLPFVTLQVMPFTVGGHVSLGMGFTLLHFDRTRKLDAVYVEAARSATLHEKPTDLAFYADLFQQLSKQALSPDDTRSLLDRLANDLWKQQREG